MYFVSHGEAFPSLIFALQGDNVTLDVISTTFISKAGITSGTLKAVPDAPFTSFELTLPEKPHSALTADLPTKANGSFCGQTMKIPTTFLAQNGLETHQNTPITVSGCTKAKQTKHKTKARKSRHAGAGKAKGGRGK